MAVRETVDAGWVKVAVREIVEVCVIVAVAVRQGVTVDAIAAAFSSARGCK